MVPVGVIGLIPLRVRGRAVLLPGGEPFSVKSFSVPSHIEQGLAQVEDTLHAEAELADDIGVTGFAVDAEGAQIVGVALLERAVVEEPEAGTLQQWMGRFGKPLMPPEEQRAGVGVIGVLNQFLQDGEAVLVAVPKVIRDQVDVVGVVSAHRPVHSFQDCSSGRRRPRSTITGTLVRNVVTALSPAKSSRRAEPPPAPAAGHRPAPVSIRMSIVAGATWTFADRHRSAPVSTPGRSSACGVEFHVLGSDRQRQPQL